MQTTQVQNGIASLFQMAKSTSTAVKQTTGSSFDDLLQTSKINGQTESNNQETKNNSVKTTETETKNQKTESKESVVETKQERPKMQDMEKTEESMDMEASETELAEKVAGLFQQVTEKIKEFLGLSEEELQSFMEQMGIAEVDLLNPSTLQNLMLLVTEQEPVNLLTDAQLLADVQELVNQVESLLKETGITEEEIATFMEQPQFEQLVFKAKEELEVSEEATKQVDVELSLEDMDNSEVVEVKETTIEFGKSVANETKNSFSNQENKESFSDQASFSEQFLQNLQQAGEEISEISGEKNVASQIREIADQILEKIKITVTKEVTSFDMVLTPEELGRVNLKIVEQDGVMKASFITENELAKEAIESNLVQFKEMLTEQGLKVDSIEVAVGNFEFNKNSETGNGQEEQKHGKRKFQGEDVVTATGTENDQLAQHFMEGGESTVNYMA